MTVAMESPTRIESARKRLRTSHACDVCRSRKIRCDGNNPCAACAAAESDCTYGSEANSRGKSDLILEGVLRVESFLHEMRAAIATSPLAAHTPQGLPSLVSPIMGSSAGAASFSCSPATEILHHGIAHKRQRPSPPALSPGGVRRGSAEEEANNNLENAVLDSMHTSTTEAVLAWPHFDMFPNLRRDYVSIFQLEQGRPPLPICRRRRRRPSSTPRARLGAPTVDGTVPAEQIDAVLNAFAQNVNFWYPTMSRGQLERVRRRMMVSAATEEEDDEEDDEDGGDGAGAESCLAALTMALGCASQVIAGLTSGKPLSGEERARRASIQAIGDMYFEKVMRRLHVAHTGVSAVATHCLFFVGMYFAFLRRPLQAWEYINAAAAKCLLLLSYHPDSETLEDQERIRRIFWSCYIMESDYLAEFSGLPPSGISRIESSIPLPGTYATHADPVDEEQSSLYFLACISLRRLLNRVHQLLYATRGTPGAATDPTRFPSVVAELQHQLDEWRDVLPAAFAFEVGFGAQPPATEHGGFLRQRYLTCRSVIYRPYLMWMLSGAGGGGFGDEEGGGGDAVVSEELLTSCKACLDACLLHILNLRGFAHTVLVDTWICSLSMAGAMLVLLAACRMPTLRSLIGPEVLAAGDHLKQLLQSWQLVMGEPSSPSVDQSVRIIGEADRFIRQVYRPEEVSPRLRLDES